MALEAIIGSLTGRIVELAVDSIRGSLGAAWNLEELEELQRHLQYIHPRLEDAEERQKVKEDVRAWLHALKKVAYEADNLLDDVEYEILRKKAGGVGKVRNFFSSRNPMAFRLKIGTKLNDILRRIAKIASEGKQFELKVSSQPESSVGRETERPMTKESCSFVKESDVVGRETEKDQIVDTLTGNLSNNTSVSIVSIVGMGGIGKTTLAQLVYNDPRVVNHSFQLRAWIWVSDVWDMEKIIESIIAEVERQRRENPGDLQESNNDNSKRELKTLEEKQIALRKALNGKRYLIVLDDVWNEELIKWKTLKDFMDCGGKGSAILVASRSKGVSELMSAVKSYDLSHLSGEDSWTLFSSRAFAPGAERPEELVEIGKDIANKCGQLPLALDMIGSLLSIKRDVREWSKIKNSSSIWELKTEIPPALWLSYKHLPPHSKRCFAFCTIFPKDHEMEKDTLIRMWMAHGFIPSSSVGIRLEDKGHEIFNQLVQRSFLHHIEEKKSIYDGIVMTCRMHDLVHDLGQSIVRNECMSLTAEESPEVAAPNDVYHLSISGLYKKKWKTSSKILRSLLSDYVHNTEIPHTSLRVLQLRHCTNSPSSLDGLLHLRYLDLSQSYNIKELPESICTLFHLQTLNLSGCESLRKLPTKMGSMISLRHLYLERCDRLKEMPRGMGRLTNLQTLTKYVVGDEAHGKGGIGELKALPLCLSNFRIYNMRHVKGDRQAKEANLHSKDIRHLELYYYSRLLVNEGDGSDQYENEGEGSDQVIDALKLPGNIEVLRIFNYAGLKSFNPAWMVELQGLVELKLKDCRGCHRLPPLWRLKSLQVLCLEHMDRLKYIIFDDGDALPAFPSLKKLTLASLWSLEGWWEKRNLATDMTAIDYFPALVSLEMWCCPELSDPMPLLPRLEYLNLRANRKMPLGSINRLTWSSLVSVDISYCGENIEKLYQKKSSDNEDSGETSIIHENSNEVSKIHNEDLHEVSGNVEDLSQMSMISPMHLREMKLWNCDWIFCPPAVGLWRSMTSLETLQISHCKSLVDLPEVLQGLTSLRSLTINGCENVTGTSSTITNPCLPPHLEEPEFYKCERLSLKSLRIKSCPNIITLAAGNQDLTSLGELTIERCDNLTSLPEGLTALQKLEIVSCENLTSLPENLTALEKLNIRYCENLTSLPQGLTALKELRITRCKNLTSLPQVLQQRLQWLQRLEIYGCPELEKKCAQGSGEYILAPHFKHPR